MSTSTRLLVVDDDHAIANLLSEALRFLRFDVKTAYSGAEAIAVAESFVPDFLISDFSMPGMNGLDSSLQIKKRFPGCRVLMLSGLNLDEDFAPLASKGYDFRLLQKPMHPSDLVGIIRSDDVPVTANERVRLLNISEVDTRRQSVSRIFVRAGFEVVEANTVAEAALKASDDPPDVILVNIDSSVSDIVTACSNLRTLFGTKASIIAMDYSRRGIVAPNRSAGVDDFIPLPFVPAKLVHRVRELLQRRLLGTEHVSAQ